MKRDNSDFHEEQVTVPTPVKVKVEKSKGEESILPLPIKVKKEKSKNRMDGDETLLPIPLVKKERSEKKKKSKKESVNGIAELPMPINIKAEKKRKNHDAGDETLLPSPLIIKKEHFEKRKKAKESVNGISDIPMPINVKEKKRKSFITSSRNCSFSEDVSIMQDTMLPSPIKVKVEKRSKDNRSEEELVPAPKRLKIETGNELDHSDRDDTVVKEKKKKKSKRKKEDQIEVPLPEPVQSEQSSDSDSENIVVPQPIVEKSELYDQDSDLLENQNVTIIPATAKVDVNKWEAAIFAKYRDFVKSSVDIQLPEPHDAEYFLLKCPKTIDPKNLTGIQWKLGGKFKIPGQKGRYVISNVSSEPRISFICDSTIKTVNVQRLLKIEKHLKDPGECEFAVPESLPVPFPENLKVRHPLFGVASKKQMKLTESTKQRLQEAEENLRKANKKLLKRQHQKKPKEEDDCEAIREIFYIDLPFSPPKKKSKKHNVTF